MAVSFNADEIFTIAERLEQNASTFYHMAAERVSYPGARQMFLDLASWEEKHEQTFVEMHKQLTDGEREEMAFDPYGETAQYLQAFADESVFDTRKNPLAEMDAEPSFATILDYAVGKEKDSITFYLGLKEMVPPGKGRDRLDGIIKEEMRHIRILTEKKKGGQG